jgi:ABC-type arginine/histidine transport system permease subunit
MENSCNDGITWITWLIGTPLFVMLWLVMAGMAMLWWRLFVNPGMTDGEIR